MTNDPVDNLSIKSSESEEDYYDHINRLSKLSNCDQIRLKIQNYLSTKEMTQTAFLKANDINSNSFRNFMSYKGKYTGMDNQTYKGALLFFEKYDKNTKAKRSTKTTEDKYADKLKKLDKANEAQSLLDKLKSVEYTQGPIYDTCEEVRKKLLTLVGSKVFTQVKLCQLLGTNANSLRNFIKVKGKWEGRGNQVYGKAYHFFERLRLADNVPKSKARVKNEGIIGQLGFPNTPEPKHVWAFGR